MLAAVSPPPRPPPFAAAASAAVSPPLPPGACGPWFGTGSDGGDDLTRIAPAPEQKALGMAVADGGVVVSATMRHSWSPAYGVAGPGTTLIYFGGVRTVGAYKSDGGGRRLCEWAVVEKGATAIHL